MLANTAKIVILASAFIFVLNQNAYAWPGQATVIVTVKNDMSEQLSSQAKLLGPKNNQVGVADVDVPPGGQSTIILTTNSTNIRGGEAFKVCVNDVCEAGVNGPSLKPENVTIALSN